MISLSIVVPAYNEERRLAGTLEKLLAYLRELKVSSEIVVVDDGSTDSTDQIVRQAMATCPQIRLISNSHSGKSYTVRTGLLDARGRYCIAADADLSTPPAEFSKLVQALDEGADIAIGSRTGRPNAPWYRQIMSVVWLALISVLGMGGFRDTQCGFKAYKTHAARDILQRTLLYSTPAQSLEHPRVNAASEIEILFIARSLGYKVAEVPVHWTYAFNTKVDPLRDSLQAVGDLAKIGWYSISGRYKLQGKVQPGGNHIK